MKQCERFLSDLWKLEWGLHYSLHNGIKLNEELLAVDAAAVGTAA